MSTQSKTMSTQEIAKSLASLCEKGQFEKAQKELFAEDVVSVEANEMPGFPREEHGLKAIIEKGHRWEKMVESTHGVKVSNPLIAGNSIAFSMEMDITMKGKGRSKMNELCVYEVKDGKVISEHFFN